MTFVHSVNNMTNWTEEDPEVSPAPPTGLPGGGCMKPGIWGPGVQEKVTIFNGALISTASSGSITSILTHVLPLQDPFLHVQSHQGGRAEDKEWASYIWKCFSTGSQRQNTAQGSPKPFHSLVFLHQPHISCLQKVSPDPKLARTWENWETTLSWSKEIDTQGLHFSLPLAFKYFNEYQILLFVPRGGYLSFLWLVLFLIFKTFPQWGIAIITFVKSRLCLVTGTIF